MKKSVIILVAPFYNEITDELIRGAVAELEANNVDHTKFEVPGALEIPVAMAMLIDNGKLDIGMFEEEEDDDEPITVDGNVLASGIIALGCVIQGETAHYDIVANESARGIMKLGMEYGVPIGNGILTVNNREQANVRASVDEKNKGRDAAQACLRLMQIKAETKTSLIERFESL